MFQRVCMTCVFTISALALGAQGQVISPQTVKTTGVIGLAQGQTARFNIFNPGVQAPALGMICTANVSLYYGDGTLIKSATLTVKPGQSEFVDVVESRDLTLTFGDRREVRAQFVIPGILPPVTAAAGTTTGPACKLVPTLEIFDNATGRTLVSLGRAVEIPQVVTPGQ